MNRRILFTLLFVAITSALCAQVKFKTAYYACPVGQMVEKYNVQQIQFTPYSGKQLLPGFTNKYLIKLSVDQPIPTGGLIINFWNEHLDTVALYRQQAGKLILINYAGNNFYTLNSPIGPATFKLAGPATQYFLKVSFTRINSLPVHVYTTEGFARFNQVLLFQLGLYHGVVMIVFLLNAFLYIVFKDKRFVYYNCFLIFLVLSFLYTNAHFSLFTLNPFWLNNADLFLHLGLAITGALFAASFLEIANIYPWLKWVTGGLLAVIALTFAINIYHPRFYLFITGEIAVFTSLTVYWVISLLRIKAHAFSKYFALAYGVLLFFTINCYILHAFNIFYFDLFTGQLEVGNIIEMFTLSAALTFSVDKLRRQNQHYRTEIDRYMHNEITAQNQTAEKADHVFAAVQQKYGLTEREAEVLKGITEGCTNQEIGEKLFLSINTIKFHTRNIFEKMEISNRAQAVSRLHEAK